MKNFIIMVVFSLIIIAGYTLFATNYIPPIHPAPPPKEEKLDLGKMTMEQFVALGEKIYKGKGTCTLCHNPVGKRAPLLIEGENPIGRRAAEQIKDPRYKGKAKNGAEYIHESEVDPSAFVVAGYGVKGTNDTVSPMPATNKGAIGLSEVELTALIAYFQDQAGVDITVEIPKEAGKAKKEAKVAAPPPPAKTPEEVVAKYGCGACHKVAGQQGAIGPDLTKIGAKRDKAYIMRAIINPNADIAKGFPPGLMPQNYKDRLTAGEFNLIVNYLANSK